MNKKNTVINKNNNKMKLQKPFLKWVGGKTQIIDHILHKFPTEINNYHEIFLGGGSVLFALLSLCNQNKIVVNGNIYAYDINESLIYVYKNIQQNHEKLYTYVQHYISMYDSIVGNVINRKPTTIEEAKTSKESFYYWMRMKFNSMEKKSVESSALFIILNKTCFRGIYREGPNGYNVPYGHYKKTPRIFTLNELNSIHELIQNVIFIHIDFIGSFDNIDEEDFVYLDPPYAPENDKSFVGYVQNGFDLDLHLTLFDKIKKWNNIKFIMSNAKVDLVMNHFKNYQFDEIIVRRPINSKHPESKTKEVIIYN